MIMPMSLDQSPSKTSTTSQALFPWVLGRHIFQLARPEMSRAVLNFISLPRWVAYWAVGEILYFLNKIWTKNSSYAWTVDY